MDLLRIVVAAPTRIGRTKVGADVGRALAQLGHQVFYFDYDTKPPSHRILPRALRFGDEQKDYQDYVNERVLDFVSRISPDVFLCVKGVQLFPETIQRIGKGGVSTVGYWIDDPLDHQRSLVNAPSYQYYFTNDASSVTRYAAEGITNIYHLPSSADLGLFHPLTSRQPLADVIFVGTHSIYRESIMVQLQDFDIRVYGPGWRKSKLKNNMIFREAFGKRTNEIFNSAKINLNIHNWFGRGTAMNLRLFEVPAAGGFLLTDWVAEIDDAYEEGTHLSCWRDIDELRGKLTYYLEHEAERIDIARKGREHFLKYHSYVARVKRLLTCIR